MSDPSYELQDALYDALKNNIGPEVGPRVYDNVPKDATFPYVTIGDAQVLADKADCIDGTEHFLQVDVWSRAVGYPEAKTISKNILTVLDDNPPPMENYIAVIFELENIQFLRDPDGLTRHVAMTFHSRVQAYEAPAPIPPVTSATGAAAGSGSASATGISGVSTTWNPADKDPAVTLSNGNLTYTGNGAARSTKSLSTGKAYWEVLINQASGESGGGAWNVGFTEAGTTFAQMKSTGVINMLLLLNGNIANSSGATVGTTFVNGDRVCMAVDFGAKLSWFRKNGGNWNNSGAANPATGVGGVSFLTFGPYYANAASSNAATSYTANFGASAFAFTVPAGFTSWDATP